MIKVWAHEIMDALNKGGLREDHQESRRTMPAQLISQIMTRKPNTTQAAAPAIQRDQLWQNCLHFGQRLEAAGMTEAQYLQHFVFPSIMLQYAAVGIADL